MSVDIGYESQPAFACGDGTIGTIGAKLIQYPVRKHVVVRANAGNESTIIIAHSEAALATGFVLSGGQMTPPIYIDDLSKIWIKGGDADQGYSWIAS